MEINEFAGAVIAECRFDTTSSDERSVLRNLGRIPADELKDMIMKLSNNEQRDMDAVGSFQRGIPDKGWKIYKTRDDRPLPNNADVAKRIEQSIRDNLSAGNLIKKN